MPNPIVECSPEMFLRLWQAKLVRNDIDWKVIVHVHEMPDNHGWKPTNRTTSLPGYRGSGRPKITHRRRSNGS